MQFKHITTNKNLPSFLNSLLKSYIFIILLCTAFLFVSSMLILNSTFKRITESTNSKALNLYGNSIDSLILQNVNDLASKICVDINNEYYLKKFLTMDINNNVTDINNIVRYLKSIKESNSMIYSIGIYYDRNQLIASTKYTRHSLYRPIDSNFELLHIKHLFSEATANKTSTTSYIFDKTVDFYNICTIPQNDKNISPYLLHIVRTIDGIGGPPKGIVIISISGDSLDTALKQYTMGGSGDIMTVNDDGLIISHSKTDKIGNDVYSDAYIQKILNSSDDCGSFVEMVDGLKSIVLYRHSNFDEFYYVSVTPFTTISPFAGKLFYFIGFVAICALLLGILLAVFYAKRISSPLSALAHTGKNRKQPKTSIYEFHQIDNAMQSIEDKYEKQKKLYTTLLPTLKINLLNDLLVGRGIANPDFCEKLKNLGIAFPYKQFFVAIIKCSDNTDDAFIAKEYRRLEISQSIEREFTSVSSFVMLHDDGTLIRIIVNIDEVCDILCGNESDFFEKWTFLSDCIVSFGSICGRCEDICLSYKIAQSGMDYSFFIPSQKYFAAERTISMDGSRNVIDKTLINQFENSLKTIDFEKCCIDLLQISDTLRSGQYNLYQMKTALASIEYVFTNLWDSQFLDDEINILDKLASSKDIDDYIKNIEEFLSATFDNMQNEKKYNATQLVNKSSEFIQSHIQDPQLSLDYVAVNLNISSKYLSRVFKSGTGIKISEYISNYKLNYARNLLITTDLKIDQIASLMGYSTAQYFINRFKLVFGFTPKQYRMQNKQP